MFTGSMVALVTPMHQDGSIDYNSLDNLIAWHLEQGTDGFVIAGTTGESAMLRQEERLKLVRTVVERVKGKVPVIAGTGGNCTRDACTLTALAMEEGADAALIMTPAYVKPTQKGLVAHFKAIADTAPLPIIIYNVPSRTACDLLPETVAVLSKIANIVAIKEATGSINRLLELKDLCRNEIKYLSGDDLSARHFMQSGGHGIISVTANVVPNLMKALCAAALNGDDESAYALDQKLAPLNKALFLETNPIPTKGLLAKLGLISNQLRLPLTSLSESLIEKVYSAYQDAIK